MATGGGHSFCIFGFHYFADGTRRDENGFICTRRFLWRARTTLFADDDGFLCGRGRFSAMLADSTRRGRLSLLAADHRRFPFNLFSYFLFSYFIIVYSFRSFRSFRCREVLGGGLLLRWRAPVEPGLWFCACWAAAFYCGGVLIWSWGCGSARAGRRGYSCGGVLLWSWGLWFCACWAAGYFCGGVLLSSWGCGSARAGRRASPAVAFSCGAGAVALRVLGGGLPLRWRFLWSWGCGSVRSGRRLPTMVGFSCGAGAVVLRVLGPGVARIAEA